MKKLFSLVAAIIITATTFAQVDEVTLTVLGTGRTEEEATNIALRSAIEQSFGAFVSANTTILNDQLVRDEIVSVSKGNIKNYDKLAVSSLPNGQVGVSIKATVSVNKLISYAKSKGSRAEFAGQTYAANVKLIKLKAESTKKAIDIMLSQMEILTNDLFDFELTLGEPILGKIYTDLPPDNYQWGAGRYILPCEIGVYANVASTNFANIYLNTLKSLCLSEEEIRLCTNNKIGVTNVLRMREYGRNENLVKDFLEDLTDKKRRAIGIIIPLSVDDNISFHKKVQNMCNNALRNFKIQEIGTKNMFEWKLREGPARTKDFVGVNKAPGWDVLREKLYLLWSNEEKKYLIDTYSTSNSSNTFVISQNLTWLPEINKCIVPIRREPIELTRAQKKAQKNGTFTGKTYKEIVGKQEKLLTLNINLYKKDLDFFKGYELKGVSAPQNK